ncbi:MAG: ISAs1 family transposase [Ktedonobacterales bacterium]|nr:ISAs1 family transposase [Ktedonobacterales bacterium]
METFAEINDPRCAAKVEHNLLEILIMAICGVIAGAEGWEDIALYAQSKEVWLRRFLTLKHGIPSHDTFRRVFMLIDPTQFEQCFRQWIGQWLGTEQIGHVAIDGKTLRHSFDRKREQSPLHVVSAWASEHRLVLGQEAVARKSNEITAIPTLLTGLDLAGALVTIDAAGCQKAITQVILDQQAEYVLTLKGNQQHTLQAVETWFDEHAFAKGSSLKPVLDAFDEQHGRLTRRRVFVQTAPTELAVLAEWPGIQSILAVEAIRMEKPQGTVTAEKRYFLSSLPSANERQIAAIRQHWSIENSLHWVLDVTFQEDPSRVREPHARRNLALLRKIALNLIHQSGVSGSVRRQRKRAAWDDAFMAQLLR